MIRGLYTSGLGMTVQMKRMDVITNNIANSDTTGYKRDIPVTQSFSEELMKRLDDPAAYSFKHDIKVGNVSQGLFVDTVHTDFSVGNIRVTNGPLDLAIDGSGFFAVSVTDANGNATEKYLRSESFTVSADGALITRNGDLLVGQNGPIVVPHGNVLIDAQGNVSADGVMAGTIKLVDFEDPQTLRKYGDNLYDVTEESVITAFTSKVVQGSIENSNANAVKEMVEMITISRAYEANQKIVGMIDTTMGQAVSDIARR